MSRPAEVPLEQRTTDLTRAEVELNEASELWCEAHVTRRNREGADKRLDAAEQDYKRALRRLEDTRKRLGQRT